MVREVMFPGGIRLTTLICLAVFVFLAVRRRDSAPLAAALVWLLGFEAAFDISREVTGYGHMTDRVAMIGIGAFTVAWFTRQGIRPSMPWLYATAAIWIVWLADGYPANLHTTTGLNWKTEVLNVAAKTTLAVAYLIPLLDQHRPESLPTRRRRRGRQHLHGHLRHAVVNDRYPDQGFDSNL